MAYIDPPEKPYTPRIQILEEWKVIDKELFLGLLNREPEKPFAIDDFPAGLFPETIQGKRLTLFENDAGEPVSEAGKRLNPKGFITLAQLHDYLEIEYRG